jgi:cyclophilin family peptidyl-prolyl cis-trans isomerase
MRNDGKGSATVYDVDRMPAEENGLKFDEPYLLAMAADKDGNTGCQFFVTL